MNDKDLTDWFPGHVKPVRRGVYQRLYGDPGMPNACGYCLFDGVWRFPRETPKDAAKDKCPSGLQNLKWRGIRKP